MEIQNMVKIPPLLTPQSFLLTTVEIHCPFEQQSYVHGSKTTAPTANTLTMISHDIYGWTSTNAHHLGEALT
jgi:hypothetical protein